MDDLEANRCFVLTSSVDELRKLPEFKRIPFIAWELLSDRWSPACKDKVYDLLARSLGKKPDETLTLATEFSVYWREHPECLY